MNLYPMVAVISLLLVLGESAIAAPLPLKLIVNDTAKECSRFLPGDECMDCSLPVGWRSIGLEGQVECPAGYAMVFARGECHGFEIPFCCIEGHSGAPGSCENLIKNDLAGECAFLGNASNCTLPLGWQRRPENMSLYKWSCPMTYNWTSVNCTGVDTAAKGNLSEGRMEEGGLNGGNCQS